MLLDLSMLDTRIRAAGIPIDGVSRQNGEYLVDFRPEATPEQRLLAASIVAAFDPAEALAKQTEMEQAPIIARAFFASSPAAVSFVRLSPTEQAAAIDGYSLTQLKIVVKFLAVAVSMLIKQELLNGQ